MWILVWQRVLFEAIIDLFYFPLWWYTSGLMRAFLWCVNFFQDGNQQLAPGLWLKNIFVPMYGQYDWQGRIISFLMRFVQVIFRFLGLMVWLVVCILLFFIWLVLPLAVIYLFICWWFI